MDNEPAIFGTEWFTDKIYVWNFEHNVEDSRVFTV